MSESLTRCPHCGAFENFEVLEELNPDTIDLNMNIIARCRVCNHTFKCKVTSHETQRQRDLGILL